MFLRVLAATAALAGVLAVGAGAQPTGQKDSGAANTATSPDVNLTPRRVIFGPNDRGVKEITVFNRTNKTATYTIVLMDRIMLPDGSIVPAEEAGAQKAKLKSATNWIRYSPRQVTLGPQEAQTIRLQARRPADAGPGEYRTHFSVTAVPPADTGLNIADAADAEKNKQLAIRLTPVYGIMIPIIVRTGELPAQAAIKDVKLLQQGGRKAVQFAVSRTGDRSIYGGLEAFLIGAGAPKKLAEVKGVGVYGEVDHRTITLALPEGASVPPGSKVRIVYTDDELKPGTILAQTDATLQ